MSEIELYDKPDFRHLKEWDSIEIRKGLASMPRTIYEYGRKVIELREALDQAKHDMERSKSKQMLVAGAKKQSLGLTSEKDRQAWVNEQDDVVEAELNFVKAKTEWELAKLKFDYCENMFVSLRKVATIIEKEDERMAQAERFADPNFEVRKESI